MEPYREDWHWCCPEFSIWNRGKNRETWRQVCMDIAWGQKESKLGFRISYLFNMPWNSQIITSTTVFKGTGETVSVFVHDVKSSSEDKVGALKIESVLLIHNEWEVYLIYFFPSVSWCLFSAFNSPLTLEASFSCLEKYHYIDGATISDMGSVILIGHY